MSIRTLLSATLGGLILCAVVSTAPVNAGEPLRVIPAVRQVEAGETSDEVKLTGWRRGFFGRRHYRFGGGFYGYRGGFYRGFSPIGRRYWRYRPLWRPYGYRSWAYSPVLSYQPYPYGYYPYGASYYSAYRPVYLSPAYPVATPVYPTVTPVYPSVAPAPAVYQYTAPATVYVSRSYYTPAVYTGYCGGGYYWDAWR